MTALARFFRFNLIGGGGVLLQLAILAALNRLAPRHLLLTSTIAVELTLLHNFAWHIRFTWPESIATAGDVLRSLFRFHLSNGLVSLVGNLILMPFFTHAFRLPVLAANALSIGCLGLANFALAHRWAFAPPPGRHPSVIPCAHVESASAQT